MRTPFEKFIIYFAKKEPQENLAPYRCKFSILTDLMPMMGENIVLGFIESAIREKLERERQP